MSIKKAAQFLLKQYTQMFGDKKVRIAMDWSKLVREVRKAGEIATQIHGNRPNATT